MSTERPYGDRPAAQPILGQGVPGDSPQEPAAAPRKKGGWGGLIALFVVAAVIWGFVAITNQNNDSGSGSVAVAEDDPIEQARVVLLGEFTYDEVKAATDAALAATGTAVSDEMRSRAWSSVLSITKSHPGMSPMAVMQCVSELGPTAGTPFPDTAALCSLELG